MATSHGKGPVDGIGGAVKRVVWNSVRGRKNIINNAFSFVDAASAANVNVIEMKSAEIEKGNKKLGLDRVFLEAESVQGISGMHCMKQEKGNVVHFALTSDMSDIRAPEDNHKPDDIAVGDWWFVMYEGKCYPGEVRKVVNGDYQVCVMEPAGQNWKWPTVPDEIFYTHEKLVRKVKPLFTVNHRGHYNFLP